MFYIDILYRLFLIFFILCLQTWPRTLPAVDVRIDYRRPLPAVSNHHAAGGASIRLTALARGSFVWRYRARMQPRRANMRAQPAGDCSIGLLLLRLLGERTSRASINKLLYKYTAVVLIIFILNLVYLIQYVYRARASERRYSLARSNERSMSTGVRSYTNLVKEGLVYNNKFIPSLAHGSKLCARAKRCS
jgi:hypothetical protein